MFIAASNWQLFSDITKEPLWMSNPNNRWFTVLKRFGYKQALFTIHDIVLDNLRYVNPFPLLRALAGGLLGGTFVIWANRKIYDLVSELKKGYTGETRVPPDWYSKWDKDDRETWEIILDLYAQAGTFGVISDISRTSAKGQYSLQKNLAFQLTPVILSEAINAGSIADTLMKTERKKGKKTYTIPFEERMKKAGQKIMREFPISKFFIEKE